MLPPCKGVNEQAITWRSLAHTYFLDPITHMEIKRKHKTQGCGRCERRKRPGKGLGRGLRSRPSSTSSRSPPRLPPLLSALSFRDLQSSKTRTTTILSLLFTFRNRNHIIVGKVQPGYGDRLRAPIRGSAINGVSNKPPRLRLPTRKSSFPRFSFSLEPRYQLGAFLLVVSGCHVGCHASFLASLDGLHPWLTSQILSSHAINTLNIVFSVTYYLELCNTIYIYCIYHILPKNVKLVVWIL